MTQYQKELGTFKDGRHGVGILFVRKGSGYLMHSFHPGYFFSSGFISVSASYSFFQNLFKLYFSLTCTRPDYFSGFCFMLGNMLQKEFVKRGVRR